MKRMIKTFYVKLAIIFILMVSGCGRASAPVDLEKAPFASFKDIPGVTAQEIAAIETLRQKHAHFVYGMNYNTVEAFPVNAGQNGISDIGGYTAHLCKWLTALFDIPFRPAFYDWNTLVSGLANHEIDFTGDLTLSDERKKTHFMTSTIAERTLSTFKIADKPSITEIAKSRSPRLVFVSGSAILDYVREATDYAFEPVFAGTHAEAYRIIKSGDADAFLTMNIVEPDFDIYGDVIIETFYPLMFGSAALTTQNPDLKPVISVVQKALENGGVRHLAELYTLGQNDYIRNKFFESLEPEEREYIQNNPVVKVATETDSYPLSFYNRNDDELQGIAFDVMRELKLITGLSFEIANPMNTSFLELTDMVESGKASMITAMMRSRERERRFLLPKTTVMQEFPILVSKSEFPNVQFNELSNVTVGIVRGTLHAELFKRWFPNNRTYREYDNLDGAFNALVHGDVDMFMAMSNYLLSLMNYKELVGYKANIKFDNNFDITFGFNKNEDILYSIIDKAMKLIDLENISDYWMHKTYDYRAKVAEGRLPWLICAAVLALIILTMILRSRNIQRQKEADAQVHEADERTQLMLEQTPLVVMLWDKDANIIECNQEAVRVTGLSSKQEYMKRLFDLTPDLPDGTTSSQAAQKAIAYCLKTGYIRIPWALHHAVTGELIPFDVTIAKVKYKGEDAAISYAQDVRERNAAIEKMREADDRARVMIEQAPLVVMLWDKDANILDCNQEALGILGLSSKEEYMERFFEIAPDQPNGMTSKAAAKMLIRKTLETGFEHVEWMLNHPETGEAIPFESTLARIKYKDEYVVMSYGQDVRERYSAIEKIREVEERAQLMIEQTPLVVMLWDKDFNILECNHEAVRIFGLQSKKEYIERFFELSQEYQPNGKKSIEAAHQALGKAFSDTGYARIEWTQRHAVTGELIPFDATLFRIKYKDEYAVLSYAQDLRELNAAIAKMRKADEKTKLMFDAMPLCSNFWTSDGVIYDCNDEVVRLFDLKDKQEYIDRFPDLSPEYQPDGRPSGETAAALVAQAFKEGYCRFEWMMQKLNGEPVPTEVFLIRLKHQDEYIVVAYFRDLREMKDSISKIREADERAMLMIEQTPLVVMLWDKDANIIDCNQEAVKVTGLSSKKEYMERLFELTPDMSDGTKAQDAAKQAVAYCLETGYIRIPWALHHAVTGELIPFDITTAKVKYKGEDAVISYGQDMRERNAAIAKIREADERAQIMIENTPLTVMVWNKDIQILDCNEEAVKTFGLSSKQEYIDRFFSLAPEYQPNGMTSQDMIQKEITKTFQTGYAYFEWMHHHGVTGEDIPFQITWIRVNYKGEIAAVSYAQDLRELRAAISKIREADERAQIMFDVAPYACCMYDKNGDMIDCNQEIVNMFGLKDKESYFKRASELSPEYQPDGELSSVKADRNGSLAIEKGIHRFEWLHRRLSGELFPAEITMVRVNYKGEYAVAGYIRDLTEQKAKENLTKEVMEKTTTLTAILDTAPDLIFVKDLESRYIQCNKSFEALMGCSCENIIGKDDAEGLNAPPEVAAAFVAEDKKIFDKKKMVSFEDHIIAADGSKVLFETVKSPLIVNGKMTGLVGIARDITKRKEMEKELLRHHALMDTVNAAAAVLLEPDTDGGINSINRSMEMVCQKMDVDRVYLWENVKKGNDELSFRQIHKWISPDYPLDSNLTEFSCGNLPYWNSQFAERKSINGPIDSFPEAEQEFLSQQEIQSILAVPLFFKEELWGFVSFDDCRKSHLFSKADEHTLSSWGLLVIGAIQRGKIMLDLEHAVSEAKRASSEAMKAYAQAEHALEAKSRFIANMNHEMRTPMNVIVGLTDLMMEEKGVPEKVKETLVKINIAGDTLMGLISDVLDISKAEAGKMDLIPVQYDVASMLNDVITLSTIRAEDKPITFKLDIHEDMFESLYGDELRVKQILNNLLSNAFKYTKKGEVTLGVSCQHDGEAVWLSFYVEDTGIGIRKEDIGRLFSDYSQVDTKANRKIDGTGLGLSITKKFVDIMDGEISVKSDYGRGTVFSARVRQGFVTDKVISKETVKSLSSLRYLDDKKKAQKKLERADLSYARVLVVDDFPTNLDVAAGMLRKYKMQVDCVMSGQESVDAIARGKPVYNAIFMDHMMPEMDGVEAVKLIRALKTDYAKNISIIALTANAVAESEKMFLENGFDAFLPKPFNTMSLDSVVQRWVRDKTKEG